MLFKTSHNTRRPPLRLGFKCGWHVLEPMKKHYGREPQFFHKLQIITILIGQWTFFPDDCGRLAQVLCTNWGNL